MTKATRQIQHLLNWVYFLFYKLSTTTYELFLQNKANSALVSDLLSQDRKNKTKPIYCVSSIKTTPTKKTNPFLLCGPLRLSVAKFYKTKPNINVFNRISKIAKKTNPFLGFLGSCVLGFYCRFTKRTQTTTTQP